MTTREWHRIKAELQRRKISATHRNNFTGRRLAKGKAKGVGLVTTNSRVKYQVFIPKAVIGAKII